MAKVMIAIPTLDYMHRRFVESLTALIKELDATYDEADVCFEGCTLVYISRDNLVWKAIDGKYKYMLWLDADMVFDKDIFWKLYKTDKDFVTGLYKGRHGTTRPCIFDNLVPPIRWDDFNHEGEGDGHEKQLVKIAGCGFGCVLIKTDILEAVMNKYGTCFTPTTQLGEDLAFCQRAAEMGYDIWANMEVKCGHIAQAILNTDGKEEML